MRYLVADVFTDVAYGGNPLAVFPDAAGLDGRQMQLIAREMNLSETSFVTPGTGPGRFAVRIFTPTAELPFAGHPTLGTAMVLQHLGRTEGCCEIVLEQGVGPVRVALGEGYATLFMTGPAETRPMPVAPAAIAEALGLGLTDLVADPWQAGYGTPFVFVALRSKAAVSASMLHADRWKTVSQGLWGHHAVYVFAVIAEDGETTHLHARLFGAGLGIVEDPATGSAAAALAGSLPMVATRLLIDQGLEMGRPSRLKAGISRQDGVVAEVSIGGGAVVLAEGRLLRLP